MKDLFEFLHIASHLVPILITLGLVAAVSLFVWGKPYLHYLALVSRANTDSGVIALAKYLARQAGGKLVKADDEWESFVPAAKAHYRFYKRRHADSIRDEEQLGENYSLPFIN